jgi:dethiobiotin synthetase
MPAGDAARVGIAPMIRSRILFITGTDTGVGKTVLGVLLVRFLRDGGRRVAACKPVCSGDRMDARQLREALGSGTPLDRINPWHFRAPLAPDLAAQQEGRRLRLAQVLAYLRAQRRPQGVLVIEGAGGLLSPLGLRFDSRDLILGLRATPVVVCPNRLGALNQVRLVLEALPPATAIRTQVVLSPPDRPDAATPFNAHALSRHVAANRITVLPRVPIRAGRIARPGHPARQALARLVASLGL